MVQDLFSYAFFLNFMYICFVVIPTEIEFSLQNSVHYFENFDVTWTTVIDIREISLIENFDACKLKKT
jgi:hypothetical protein